jgi:hypothetical protein
VIAEHRAQNGGSADLDQLAHVSRQRGGYDEQQTAGKRHAGGLDERGDEDHRHDVIGQEFEVRLQYLHARRPAARDRPASPSNPSDWAP